MTNQKAQKCIWMEAGVVQYKLCDMDLNCEQCNFHKSLTSIQYQEEISFNQKDEKCLLLDSIILPEEKNTYIEDFFSKFIPGLFCYLDRYYIPPYFWLFKRNNSFLMGIIPIWQFLIPPKAELHTKDSSYLHENEVILEVKKNSYLINMVVPFNLHIKQKLTSGPPINVFNNPQTFPVWSVEPEHEHLIPTKSLPMTEIVYWYLKVLKIIKLHLYCVEMNLDEVMCDGGSVLQDLTQLLNPDEFNKLILNIADISNSKIKDQ